MLFEVTADPLHPQPLIDHVIAQQTLWECTTCMACVTACPTGALEFTSGDQVAAEKREAFMVQIERSLSKGSV